MSVTAANTPQPNLADVQDSYNFLRALQNRHTYYAINDQAPISNDAILEIVRTVVLNVPSSFNSQSARLVVLFGEEHKALWDITLKVLEEKLTTAPEATVKKIHGFKAGYGTILFYEDPVPVDRLIKGFPSYADKFPQWSEHTSAMHQLALWTALEAEGFGASLQHYDPLINKRVAERFQVNPSWSLKAQLVFGGRADKDQYAVHGTKRAQEPLEARILVRGQQVSEDYYKIPAEYEIPKEA